MRRNFTAMTLGVCCAVALAGANAQAAPTNTQPAADAAPQSSLGAAQPASGVSQPQPREAACAEPKKSCEAPKIAACQNGGWVCIGPAQPDR